jgi:hypothetical protein
VRISDTYEFLRVLEAEFAEEMPGPFPVRTNRPLGFPGDPLAEFESVTPPGEPLFWVACTGCAERGCIPILRNTIIEAIRLAVNAADKLEAASRPGRNAEADKTARLFRAFFCHDPTTPISWAGGEPSGLSVARRLRLVARELGGGRRMIFVCLPTRPGCPDGDATCCGAGEINARSVPGTSTIGLCDGFWNEVRLPGLPNIDRRAGTIIHETLHLLFASATGGIRDRNPRRANAHCYKAFVLRANGFGGDPLAVAGCGLC